MNDKNKDLAEEKENSSVVQYSWLDMYEDLVSMDEYLTDEPEERDLNIPPIDDSFPYTDSCELSMSGEFALQGANSRFSKAYHEALAKRRKPRSTYQQKYDQGYSDGFADAMRYMTTGDI